VNRRAVPLRRLIELGKCLLARGDDRDVVPLRAGGIEDEEREATVSGD
jgi:hypothetical protein